MTTQLSNNDVSIEADEHRFRFENVIYLATLMDSMHGRSCGPLEPFFDDGLSNDELNFVFNSNDVAAQIAREYGNTNDLDNLDDDDFCEAVKTWIMEHEKYGFLVQVATPVCRNTGHGVSYSWGHYKTKWIYGETITEVVERTKVWIKAVRENEKLKGNE